MRGSLPAQLGRVVRSRGVESRQHARPGKSAGAKSFDGACGPRNPLDRGCASSMYGPMSSLRFRIASVVVAMIAVSSAGLSGCVHHRDYVLPIDVARGALQCAGGPIQTVMIDDRTRGVIGCNRHVAVILTCEYQRAGAFTMYRQICRWERDPANDSGGAQEQRALPDLSITAPSTEAPPGVVPSFGGGF